MFKRGSPLSSFLQSNMASTFPKLVRTARTMELSAKVSVYFFLAFATLLLVPDVFCVPDMFPFSQLQSQRVANKVSIYDSPFFSTTAAGALGIGLSLAAAFTISPLLNYSKKVCVCSLCCLRKLKHTFEHAFTGIAIHNQQRLRKSNCAIPARPRC